MAKRRMHPIEDVLSKNLLALLAEYYDKSPGVFARKHKNIVLSRIQSVSKTGACNLQTLGHLANAFGLRPYQLLIPDLDVKHPQVATKAKHAKLIENLTERGDE